MKVNIFRIFIILVLFQLQLKAQDKTVRPQLWNNLYLGWEINDRFSLQNSLAYNVLLSQEVKWQEFSNSISSTANLTNWFAGTAGLYVSKTQQIDEIWSSEVRPFASIRFLTLPGKRWRISNRSRFEWRNIFYSKIKDNSSLRFRNRTSFSVSLIKSEIIADNNLSLYGFFEFFHNFDKNVQERFFTQSKTKLGFYYRKNFHWRFDLGFMYQDAKSSIVEATILPTNYITNYIIDWGIIYIIATKKKK